MEFYKVSHHSQFVDIFSRKNLMVQIFVKLQIYILFSRILQRNPPFVLHTRHQQTFSVNFLVCYGVYICKIQADR